VSARLTVKLGTAAVSLLVSGALAWAFLQSRPRNTDTVKITDNSGMLDELYTQRHEEGAGKPVPPPGNRKEPDPLPRGPLPRSVAEVFWPDLTRRDRIFDPLLFKRREPHVSYYVDFPEHPDGGFQMTMNSSGVRGDTDILEEPPDVRIVVVGDSHVQGVVAAPELLTSRMQGLFDESDPERSFEVINGAMGGYNVYNYVGGSEYFTSNFKPDFYVVIVMGGNDFSGAISVYRYYKKLKKPVHLPIRPGKVLEKFKELGGFGGVGPQEINQAMFFSNNPGDVPIVKRMMVEATHEMRKQCDRSGTRLVCVYLPPPLQGQPRLSQATRLRVMEASGLTSDEIARSDEIADWWIHFMRKSGIDYIDLRPVFRQQEELLYWESDHHLNVRGHDLTGRVLHAALEGMIARGPR